MRVKGACCDGRYSLNVSISGESSVTASSVMASLMFEDLRIVIGEKDNPDDFVQLVQDKTRAVKVS